GSIRATVAQTLRPRLLRRDRPPGNRKARARQPQSAAFPGHPFALSCGFGAPPSAGVVQWQNDSFPSLRLAHQINGLSDKFPFRAHIETIDELYFVGTPNVRHHSPSLSTFPNDAVRTARRFLVASTICFSVRLT